MRAMIVPCVAALCLIASSADAATICTRPQFAKEMELRAKLYTAKDADEARRAGRELDALIATNCRTVPGRLTGRPVEHTGDNCQQMVGTYRGQTVYWGECFE